VSGGPSSPPPPRTAVSGSKSPSISRGSIYYLPRPVTIGFRVREPHAGKPGGEAVAFSATEASFSGDYLVPRLADFLVPFRLTSTSSRFLGWTLKALCGSK
jgi:hypothetical protein